MEEECWLYTSAHYQSQSDYTPNNPQILSSQDRWWCSPLRVSDFIQSLLCSGATYLFDQTTPHQSESSVLLTLDKTNELGKYSGFSLLDRAGAGAALYYLQLRYNYL